MSPQKCGRYAGIAQSVEHFTRNEGVVSSSLISGFTIKRRNPSDTEGLRFFARYARRATTVLARAGIRRAKVIERQCREMSEVSR